MSASQPRWEAQFTWRQNTARSRGWGAFTAFLGRLARRR